MACGYPAKGWRTEAFCREVGRAARSDHCRLVRHQRARGCGPDRRPRRAIRHISQPAGHGTQDHLDGAGIGRRLNYRPLRRALHRQRRVRQGRPPQLDGSHRLDDWRRRLRVHHHQPHERRLVRRAGARRQRPGRPLVGHARGHSRRPEPQCRVRGRDGHADRARGSRHGRHYRCTRRPRATTTATR